MVKKVLLQGVSVFTLLCVVVCPLSATQQPNNEESRIATRDKLRKLLQSHGPGMNVVFRQNDAEPFFFSGILTQGLTNAESFEIVIGVTTADTISFRISQAFQHLRSPLAEWRRKWCVTLFDLYFPDSTEGSRPRLSRFVPLAFTDPKEGELQNELRGSGSNRTESAAGENSPGRLTGKLGNTIDTPFSGKENNCQLPTRDGAGEPF